MRYLVVIEKTESGYSARCPDFDGCVATARTRPDVEEQIGRVLEFHLCGLRHLAVDVPLPTAYAIYIELAARRAGARVVQQS
jgi:predicted RNase H-like HicB family nuclease